MAHIEKRRTSKGEVRYRAQITLKGYPRVSETFGTRREAQRWAERTTEAIRQRRFEPGSEAEQHTVGDLIERYVRDKLPGLSTSENTGRTLDWWQDQLGKDTRLSQITPATIASARDRLARGESLSGRVPCSSTVKRYLTVLSSALGTATKEWFWLEANPCSRIVRPSDPRGRVRCLEESERTRLLSACKESRSRRLYPLVVTALCTGARRGELLNLRWRDVDLDRGVAILHQTKNGERRSLAITGLAEQVLREWAEVRGVSGGERSTTSDQREGVGNDKVVSPSSGAQPTRRLSAISDHVFSSPTGSTTFPKSAWEQARDEAGIDDFRFHDLRHTFASYLAMSGATLAELAEAMGHKTLVMVKRYAHLTHGHTANVVARMTDHFLAAA